MMIFKRAKVKPEGERITLESPVSYVIGAPRALKNTA